MISVKPEASAYGSNVGKVDAIGLPSKTAGRLRVAEQCLVCHPVGQLSKLSGQDKILSYGETFFASLTMLTLFGLFSPCHLH